VYLLKSINRIYENKNETYFVKIFLFPNGCILKLVTSASPKNKLKSGLAPDYVLEGIICLFFGIIHIYYLFNAAITSSTTPIITVVHVSTFRYLRSLSTFMYLRSGIYVQVSTLMFLRSCIYVHVSTLRYLRSCIYVNSQVIKTFNSAYSFYCCTWLDQPSETTALFSAVVCGCWTWFTIRCVLLASHPLSP
jgi:cellulose synthase/poly-beta-1,6-N-acetylglucosamine synthase-like glycosyltransferase